MRALRLGAIALGTVLLLAACAAGVQQVRLGGGPDAPLAPSPEGALRIATHNVHYIDLRATEGPWSRAGWERRRTALDAAFRALGADAVAFQEMESFAGGSQSTENLALDWLLSRNPGYAAAAEGDPARFPSTQPILYRTDRLALLDEGWFFFSETPDRLYSRGFDGAPPSFASWARFRDRTDEKKLTAVNIHFDYGSWENRRRSADLVATFVAERIAHGERVVLAGDLNARAGSDTMAILERAGLGFPPVPGATFHLNRGLNLFGAIDHIGLSPDLAAIAPVRVLRKRFDGAWPSDHYPVALDIRPR